MAATGANGGGLYVVLVLIAAGWLLLAASTRSPRTSCGVGERLRRRALTGVIDRRARSGWKRTASDDARGVTSDRPADRSRPARRRR